MRGKEVDGNGLGPCPVDGLIFAVMNLWFLLPEI